MATCRRFKNTRNKVCAGALDEIIQIYDRSVQLKSGSHDIELPIKYPNIFASVTPTAGKEVFNNTNEVIGVSHVFRIRYLNVSADDWVEWDGKYYDIVTTQETDSKKQYLLLNCNERGITSNRLNRV